MALARLGGKEKHVASEYELDYGSSLARFLLLPLIPSDTMGPVLSLCFLPIDVMRGLRIYAREGLQRRGKVAAPSFRPCV